MDFEQLQDAQHDIIDVAEARSLSLLGVMHATCEAAECIHTALLLEALHVEGLELPL